MFRLVLSQIIVLYVKLFFQRLNVRVVELEIKFRVETQWW